MFKLFSNQKFFAPDDTAGAGGTASLDDKNLGKDDLYDLLGDDEEPAIDLEEGETKEKKATKETKETKKIDSTPDEDDESGEEDEEDEVDELEELEAELEGPDEEQLELTTPVRRKEILTKYPNLFKDFPYLEKAYYREQQFTEIYPTIDDARNALEKSQTLDKFETELMKGDSENILKTIKDSDQNAFHKIVDNYMVALWNTDQMAYHHVIGNLNKALIADMVTQGRRQNNESYLAAAAIVQQFIFGQADWTAPTRLAKDTNNPDKQNLDNERMQFVQQRFDVAREDLGTRLNNSLAATIDQHIDPKGAMTSFVKKAASDSAMKTLQRLLNSDTRFQGLKDKLWEKAMEENFSKASIDRIKSAFTSRAKTLLPTVIKKARIEALKGLGGRKAKDDTEDRNDGSTRAQNSRKTTSSSNSGRGDNYRDKASKIPRGMSSLDYLNSD